MRQEITFTITRVTILCGSGADKVYLHTCNLSPCPGISKEELGLDFSVARGDGFRYVTEHLRVDPKFVEIIDV